MEPTRRSWRRAAGGLAFVMAIAFLASRTCQSEAASAEVRVRVGAAAPSLRLLRVELYRGEDPEQLGFSEWRFGEAGSGEVVGPWRLRADAGMYRLAIEARLAGKEAPVEVSRAIEVKDGAVVTIDVGDEISGAAAGP